jgi:hypothetical protein
VLSFLVVIFAVVHPTVVVFQADIDAAVSVTLVDKTTMTGSQFIIFIVSTVTAFITAIIAFYSPLRRWQQIRDAEMTMRSAIWQYRTRTGPYQCGSMNNSQAANVLLREQVLACRANILGSADMQETSFYKHYPSKIYRHGQRSAPDGIAKPGARARVAPEVGLDLESLEGRNTFDDDDHHSPVSPDSYIRLRLFVVMTFYRQRLPKYSAFLERCQFLVMAGAVIRYPCVCISFPNSGAARQRQRLHTSSLVQNFAHRRPRAHRTKTQSLTHNCNRPCPSCQPGPSFEILVGIK